MTKSSDLASRLNKRVMLQEEVPISDGAGGYNTMWQDVATVWAEMKPLQGERSDEPFIAMQQEGRNYARVVMRYRSDVTPKLRLMFGMRIFNILHVINPGETNEQLELLVVEGAAI